MLLIEGHREFAAGVDEAGRGCLAGPVAAAAVIFRPNAAPIQGLDDSKKLNARRREQLAEIIRREALCWSLGLSWPPEIDAVNILQATRRAMARAVSSLKTAPTRVLIDGNQTIPVSLPQETVIKGDALVPVISAASILAKTFRDRLMAKLDRRYPGYGFASHKGYGAKAHREAIRRLGPCPMHRLTFAGVKPASERQEQTCLPGI
jgi:ribonuclease HII